MGTTPVAPGGKVPLMAAKAAQSTASGFFYLASKPTGGRSMGVRSAESERALAQMLRREKLILTRAWKLPASVTTDRPMLPRDQAAMNDQLAQLLSRGVPLVEALDVAGTVVSKHARPRVQKMKEKVGAGGSFSDACAAAGSFDEVTIAVYRAAERTGDLAGACQELAHSIRRRLSVRGKAVTLLIYPAIVLTISIIVGIVMLIFIVPTLLGDVAELGVDLPWFSRAMLVFGNTLREQWLIALAVVAAGLVGLVLGRGAIAKAFGRLSRALPLVGPVILAQESTRFFSVMGAMTRSGIPMADALGVASAAVSHAKLRKQLERLRTRLIEGGVLGRLISDVEALPVATRKLLVAAEKSGDLETAFSQLAADMAELVDTRTQRLLAFLEPLLSVGMVLFIGGMLLAIMIPMLSATSAAAF